MCQVYSRLPLRGRSGCTAVYRLRLSTTLCHCSAERWKERGSLGTRRQLSGRLVSCHSIIPRGHHSLKTQMTKRLLTLSLPRVINFKFPLQLHTKYNIAQYAERGFSLLTQVERPYFTFIFKRVGECTVFELNRIILGPRSPFQLGFSIR